MKLSFSRLSQLLICPAREKFRQAGAIGPWFAAGMYGDALHRGLGAAFKNEDPGAAVEQVIQAALSGQPYPGEEPDARWNGQVIFTDRDEAPELMIPWISQAIETYLCEYPDIPEQVEHSLSRDYGDFELHGIIDAVQGGTLIDFKLKGGSSDPDKRQLVIYSMLIGQPTPAEFRIFKKVGALLLGGKPEIKVVTVPEAQDLAYQQWLLENTIRPAVRMIEAGYFPANDQQYLSDKRYCSYWDSCIGKINHAGS